MNHELITHEGRLFKLVDTPLYTGYIEDRSIPCVKEEPSFQWKGTKIPFALWQEIITFMLWSQRTHKQEAMLFLFYNRETNEWAIWVPPQEPNGMTVKTLSNHPTYDKGRKLFGRAWIQLGSVHHHCTSSAFQSGVDKSDEEGRDGLHITLGNLDKDQISIHLRQVLGGNMSPAYVDNWLEPPEYVKLVPEYLVNMAFLEGVFLSVEIVKGLEPSKEQKAQIILPTKKDQTPPHVLGSLSKRQREFDYAREASQKNQHRHGGTSGSEVEDIVMVILVQIGITTQEALDLMSGHLVWASTEHYTESLAVRAELCRLLGKEGISPSMAISALASMIL